MELRKVLSQMARGTYASGCTLVCRVIYVSLIWSQSQTGWQSSCAEAWEYWETNVLGR